MSLHNILTSRVEWSIYQDRSNFSLWVVHPVEDTSPDSLRRFYFLEEPDANSFLALISKSCHKKTDEKPHMNDFIPYRRIYGA